MADETQAATDPSMEEILASIRKIISDDNPEELTPVDGVDSTSKTTPDMDQYAAVAEPFARPGQTENVLELTQMVEEDGSVTDMTAIKPSPPPPVRSIG